MHGSICCIVKKFVDTNHGPEAWNAILEHAGHEGLVLSPIGTYPDEAVFALLGAGCELLQVELLEEPPRPKNFLEVIELVEKGEPVPGIKDIDDRPPNPDVALPPVSEDFEERTKKPWSMKPSDDESFEGHRPWDKYGNGAAASGEYSFDGGGGGGGGGWTPPSVPQMSDSARTAYGL